MASRRILHIISSMEIGGAETMLMNIYRAIDRDKIQFDFFVSTLDIGYYEPEIESMGGVIYRSTPKSKTPIKYIKNLKRVLKKQSYSSIHIHASNAKDFISAAIAKSSGVKKRIYHSHSSKGYSMFKQRFSRSILNLFITDRIACSKTAGEWMYGKKQFKIIYNPINIKQFTFNDDDRNNIRKKMKINSKIVFIHVGRFEKPKNHVFLIDIFKEIKKIDNNTVLLLVGQGTLEKEIKDKVKNLGIEDSVMFLGAKTDVDKYLSASDCFIMPSLYEGFPVTIVESQANGLQSLLSNSITSEIKQSNTVKFLSLQDSAEVWALKALEMAKKNNIDRGKDLKIIERKYDSSVIAKELMILYSGED